eukprot:921915-Alexandrium_andersonii.AAC.1
MFIPGQHKKSNHFSPGLRIAALKLFKRANQLKCHGHYLVCPNRGWNTSATRTAQHTPGQNTVKDHIAQRVPRLTAEHVSQNTNLK